MAGGHMQCNDTVDSMGEYFPTVLTEYKEEFYWN